MDSSIHTTVVALYIHGERPSHVTDTAPIPMIEVPAVDVVTDRGMRQDPRYFRFVPGRERKRQISLIDEGTIQRHEAVFGPIDRSLIKAQIILAGDVRLTSMIDTDIVFESGATLRVALMRKPCHAMDLIAPGLKEAMEDGEQGALAVVAADGPIAVGDRVEVRPRVVEGVAG